MADEPEAGLSAALHTVFSVTATNVSDVFIVDCEITDMNSQRYRCPYVSTPDDTFGLAPTIRAWLTENADSYTVLPAPIDET